MASKKNLGQARYRMINRLPRPSRVPIRPRGEKQYTAAPLRVTGPGNPPNGFLGGQNSATEWVVYWAMWQVFKEPGDVRQGPFSGSPTGKWSYQAFFQGGRRVRGGSVIDFLVYAGVGTSIAIRVQTERYHIFVDSATKAYDRMQVTNLGKETEVVDLYEQDFIGDRTGTACILALKNIVSGMHEADPTVGGTARRGRGVF